jgi:hypothetical protein
VKYIRKKQSWILPMSDRYAMNFLMLQEKLLRVGYGIFVWGIVFGFESIILSASTWADPTLCVKTTGLSSEYS